MNKLIPFEEARKSTGAVLIEFFASWCPHCQRMVPVVEEVRNQLGGQIPVYQYDIDKYKQATQEAGVENLPTFIIYNNGKEVWRHVGETDAKTLVDAAESALKTY